MTETPPALHLLRPHPFLLQVVPSLKMPEYRVTLYLVFNCVCLAVDSLGQIGYSKALQTRL